MYMYSILLFENKYDIHYCVFIQYILTSSLNIILFVKGLPVELQRPSASVKFSQFQSILQGM